MTMKRHILISLSVVTWLAGCATGNPTGTTSPSLATAVAATPLPKAAPTPKPTATPKSTAKKPVATASGRTGTTPTATPSTKAGATPAATPAAAPDAMAILNDVKAATLGASSLKGSITTFEMKADKSVSNSGTFTLLNQDKSYRLDCSAHTKPSNVGAKFVLVYGTPTVRVKPAGILSLVTVTLQLTDANLISKNGITLDKILSHGVLERLTNGDYTAEVAGTTTIGSDKISILKLKCTTTNPIFGDADYEYVGYDENKLYRTWSIYAKPELGLPNNLLYQVTVNDVEAGVPVPADTFKL